MNEMLADVVLRLLLGIYSRIRTLQLKDTIKKTSLRRLVPTYVSIISQQKTDAVVIPAAHAHG